MQRNQRNQNQMKYVIFLGDGMADYPIPELDGKTPVNGGEKASHGPDCAEGRTGLFRTIEPDMMTGSAIANLSVLGYNAMELFHGTEGRGVLEAASLGVHIDKSDLAMRVNLICIEDGKIRSHSAGHITTEEAHTLIRDAQEHFNKWNLRLYPGLSYRHVLIVPKGEFRLECAPPHDHVGTPWRDLAIRPMTPKAGNSRIAEPPGRGIAEISRPSSGKPETPGSGKQPANSLWPWAPGKKPVMQTLQKGSALPGRQSRPWT